MLGITMKSNPTTGFKWHMDKLSGDCIEAGESTYQMDKRGYMEPGITGVGGTRTMEFGVVGNAGCKEKIRLYYAQPWTF